ncbi:MAG TPA: DedA family protein [Acetobacteraceae bacterium]|nr:DedA family protein [Acetobacteraceae bacterium]
MSFFSLHHLTDLLHDYGYGLVGLVVGLEAMGLPLPGESLVIAAALYAGSTHELSIPLVVAAAALGAIIGDNIGYLIGRVVGLRLLRRYGSYVLLPPERLEVGRRLFAKHGGKVVLFGRFVAILRTLAALLAGANGMSWPRFLLANAVGGIAWACLYGFGAYALGHAITRVQGPLGIAAVVVAIVVIAATVIYTRRKERRLAKAHEVSKAAD